TALMILLFFGGLLWGKFWCRGAALEILTFSQMHKHPDGTAYILLDNQLFGFNDKAEATQTIDLARLGIASGEAATDFAFFANGDLLLRRQLTDGGFIYNLQRYFRFTNLQDKNSHDVMTGLFRCNVTRYQCRPFSDPPLNLMDAFTLSIDWQTDHVFVADTNRHTVRMFSASGKELDAQDRFYFPNQIHFQDHKLYVADTNHHVLTSLTVMGGQLVMYPENIFTKAHPYRQSGDIWPSSFAIIGNQYWIRNANDNMEHGGIYVFDQKNHFIKRLILPEHADPYALLQLGQTVLVSDFSLGRIYRFNLEGTVLPDFQPIVFQTVLTELKNKKTVFQYLDLAFTSLFAFGLVGGFAYALQQQRGKKLSPVEAAMAKSRVEREAAINAKSAAMIPKHWHGMDVHWMRFSFRFKMFWAILGLVEFLMLAVLAVILYFIKVPILDFLWTFFQKHYLLVIAAIFGIILIALQFRRKIGFSDKYAIVFRGFGKPIICPKEHILYRDDLVLLGKMVLSIRQIMKTYKKEDIEEWLYPAIKQGRHLELSEMQNVLMKKTYIRVFWALVAASLIGCFVYYGFES
ncbi:hypothetical protein, partial [Methylovulum sp.]